MVDRPSREAAALLRDLEDARSALRGVLRDRSRAERLLGIATRVVGMQQLEIQQWRDLAAGPGLCAVGEVDHG